MELLINVKGKKGSTIDYSSPEQSLRGVTCQCHMGSHSVTCHPTGWHKLTRSA